MLEERKLINHNYIISDKFKYRHFTIILSLFIFLLATLNYQNGDYQAYQIIYNQVGNVNYSIEPGFVLLIRIFKSFNLDFFFF